MTVDVDIAKMQALRQAHNQSNAGTAKVSLTHVLIKAVASTLVDFPALHGAFDGRRLVHAPSIRVNLPVAEGAHVEYVVIDSPERKSLGAIAHETSEEVQRIHAGQGLFFRRLHRVMRLPRLVRWMAAHLPAVRIKLFNETYGNFPITNFGSFGVKSGVPVLASPAVGVLCLGAAQAGILPVGLVFDHRCVDGAQGGLFLGALKGLLERDPEHLFV
jgi:pyruvate/2-oxoglutarate dehydrogenase complex dihydrolipoamide acyltransferase (E2) component